MVSKRTAAPDQPALRNTRTRSQYEAPAKHEDYSDDNEVEDDVDGDYIELVGAGGPARNRARVRKSNETASRETSFNRSSSTTGSRSPNASFTSQTSAKSSNSTFLIFISLIVVAAVVVYTVTSFTHDSPSSSDVTKNCSVLLELKAAFPGQDEIYFWRQLKVGVEHVLTSTPPQPTVFLIAHQDKRKAAEFMDQVARTVHTCLGAEGAPLIYQGAYFNQQKMIQDYGRVIAEVKPHLDTAKVLVVLDVQLVHQKVIEAFHTICDKETPMIEKSVIFFTLPVPVDASSRVQQLYYFVEEELSKLWGSAVNQNKIQPLLARMT